MLTVSAVSLVTTEGGTGASFDAQLASTPSAPVEVEVRSGDPTEGIVSVAGYGGAAPSRELTFTPQDWDVPRRVVVQPVDDGAADGSVGYAVSLRVAWSEDPAFAAAPHAEVSVQNLDDDAPGFVVVPEGGAPLRTDEDGATASLTVWLSCAPAGTVQLPVTVGDVTEGLVLGGSSPFTPQPSVTVTFTPSDWQIPREITVVGIADAWADGDQSYLVTVGPPIGDAVYGALPPQTVEVVNANTEWRASVDVPKGISDYLTASSELPIAGAPTTLSRVRVRVNITHTFDADLVISLVSPSGTAVTLANSVGGSGDNFRNTIFDDLAPPIASGWAPFTGTYAPSQSLSALGGQDANGTWTLRVSDTWAGDLGTLDGWALRLE